MALGAGFGVDEFAGEIHTTFCAKPFAVWYYGRQKKAELL
jgi:hypothetical protein